MNLQFNQTPQLNEALAQAKVKFEPIIADETAAFRTKTGGEIKFDYADLADILPATTEALSEHGLALSSQIVPTEGRLYLVTRLLHSSGESIESYFPLPLEVGADPKGFGSSVTYGRRYNILCLLEISVVDDDITKKQRREKTAIEMRREINNERVQPVAKAPSKPPSIPPVPPASKTEQSSPPDLYPRNNAVVKRIRELTGHSSKQIVDWCNSEGFASPGQLEPQLLEELLTTLALEWGLKQFGSRDEAKARYCGKVAVLRGSGMGLADAIASWIKSVQPVGGKTNG